MRIEVVENVMRDNDAVARANRDALHEAGALCINITSAPGSGKTALLERTLRALGPEERCAVLVGDLQTTRDAERLEADAAEVVQINTGRGCHLTAAQVAAGIAKLDPAGLHYLFIENVGNMVCPAGFDLGEDLRVAMLSLPEGDDKAAKYPTLFQAADLIVLNKIDLSGLLPFETRRVREDLARLNTRAPFLEISARTGEGFAEWLAWLRNARRCAAQEAESARCGAP